MIERDLWPTLIANAVSILAVIFFAASVGTVIWAYWIESMLVGVFVVITMVRFESLHILLRLGAAAFFTFHYGFFHLIYLVFLFAMPQFHAAPKQVLFVAVSLVIVNIYRFVTQPPAQSITESMGKAYARIIPMHITIIASGFLVIYFAPGRALATAIIVVFMALKTYADVQAYRNPNKTFWQFMKVQQ